MPARYDGTADWYDENIAWYSAAATPLILRLTEKVQAAASTSAAGPAYT